MRTYDVLSHFPKGSLRRTSVARREVQCSGYERYEGILRRARPRRRTCDAAHLHRLRRRCCPISAVAPVMLGGSPISLSFPLSTVTRHAGSAPETALVPPSSRCVHHGQPRRWGQLLPHPGTLRRQSCANPDVMNIVPPAVARSTCGSRIRAGLRRNSTSKRSEPAFILKGAFRPHRTRTASSHAWSRVPPEADSVAPR